MATFMSKEKIVVDTPGRTSFYIFVFLLVMKLKIIEISNLN